jgi:hypothetical protein
MATLLVAGLPLTAMAGTVAIDGQAVKDASSEVRIEKEVLEFREGGSNVVQLIPGLATYRVCVQSRLLIPAVEAACAPGSSDPFVDVTVEDGREFVRCLVESSNTIAPPVLLDCGKRSGGPPWFAGPPKPACSECCACADQPGTRYCFRCEGAQ